MNLLAAFVWLRWRLLLNSLRGGRRRDALESLSRVASLLAPALVGAVFVIPSLVLAFLGFLAGGFLAGPDPRVSLAVTTAVRLLLLAVCAVLILVPLGRSMQGGFPGTERLLLLPIPRSLLHFLDVAAGLLDPWLAFLIPGMITLSAGIALSGHLAAAVFALAAGVALFMALVSLSALATFAMQWVLRDRRRGELAAFIFVFALACTGLVPAFLVPHTEDNRREVSITLPTSPWTLPFPTELFAWSLRAAVAGRGGAALAGVGGLLLEAAALFACSSKVHARLLTTTAASGRRVRGAGGLRDPRTLPGLGPAAAGIARAQVSTALRTLRGRMGVFLNAPALLVFGFAMHRLGSLTDLRPIGFTADGPTLFAMGGLLSLLSLQPILMNQFASDRAGLTLQFLSPVDERDLLLGKACGGVWLAAMSGGLCLLSAWVIAPHAPLLSWVCAAAAVAATIILGAPVAALLSLLFPRRADLSRMGGAGNAHAAAVLLGTLLVMLAALPGSLFVMAGSWLAVPVIAAAGAVAWLAIAAVLGWGLVRLMTPVLRERRENLFLVAGGG